MIDLSHNKLRALPDSMGSMRSLKEVLLFHNHLTALPYALGKLHAVHTLGLDGNPLVEPLASFYRDGGTREVLQHLLDNSPIWDPPPARSWIEPASRAGPRPAASAEKLSVLCYNVLCDKYATRQLYGYCPSWALHWDYRKAHILKEVLEEVLGSTSDVVLLQEVETREYHSYFLPELTDRGYAGLFQAKSRARTMHGELADTVDGCAIFYRTARFSLKADRLIEFERIAGACSQGSVDMLNRVMPKDNVAIVALLESTESGQTVCVTNAHLTWDPIYKDVKVIQAAMLTREVRSFLDEHCGGKAVPIVMGGDFNSTPDSGVVEYLTRGRIDARHTDLVGHDYSRFASGGVLEHRLALRSAYTNEMRYTNFTADFKDTIDYCFYSATGMTPIALLGPVATDTIAAEATGCPNPHFPSDHFSLGVQFALHKR